jgi:hypothetical protein
MNYKIIADEEKLKDFIDWLPELAPHEIYYLCLFARKKYMPGIQGIKSDKSQMKRFTAEKSRMLYKIQQLECPLGSYRHNGQPIPNEALALYITPSPRDLKKANIQSLIELAQVVKHDSLNNPHQTVMSTIQQTRSRKSFVTFDIDSKDPVIIDELMKANGIEDVSVIETRGGYHFMVRPEKMPKDAGQWHKTFSEHADQHGDILCPVIGTYQGGFEPRFVQQR